MINEFRKKELKLRPVTYLSNSYSSPPDIPYAYIWSPHLVPKPKGNFSLSHFIRKLRIVHLAFGDLKFCVCCAHLSEGADWGPKIDVVGFCFLDLASNYVPPDSLVNWLNEGKKPIYIGFGSLVSNYLGVFLPILFVSFRIKLILRLYGISAYLHLSKCL